MSYNSDFERAFMERSLELVRSYKGPYDATLLLNCLLGLLLVPKETCLKQIPADPIDALSRWGISPSAIENYGLANGEDDDPHNLRGLVWHLRNAIAHFRFKPEPERGAVEAFRFSDNSGFRATVPVYELRVFVERLADHLRRM